MAGIGRANTNQRMLFPLMRTERAEAMIRRALPELPWPSEPLLRLPTRVYRTLPDAAARIRDGFYAAVPAASGVVAAAGASPPAAGFRARLRQAPGGTVAGRRKLRGPAMATATHPQHGGRAPRRRSEHRVVEFPVEGQGARGRVQDEVLLGPVAKIRYMVDDDALLLCHAVGRPVPVDGLVSA